MDSKPTIDQHEFALNVAGKVKAYWKAKGHNKVRVWIEPVAGKHGEYQVRSDLTNGAPSAKS
jgi:hypothetical protein